MPTLLYPITDWDDAYANAAHIEGSDAYPARWLEEAARFRDNLAGEVRAELDIAYGDDERQTLDLFRPHETPRGLVVFIHGGYWKAFDKSFWSHLAEGALAHGHAVAMPSYRLTPDVRISEIVGDAAYAVLRAGRDIEGPIRLCGHSAGGHLAARLIAHPSPLDATTLARIVNTVSISGLHDLRPLMATGMNDILRVTEAEALAESPALLRPVPGTRIVAWAGADERPEFLRQNRLLGLVWDGFGVETQTHEDAGRHHFDVIDGLRSHDSPLLQALMAGGS